MISHLVIYLEDNGIYFSHHFGFRKSMSTNDHLILVHNDVSDWVDFGFLVDVVLIDYSKAFDIVCGSVLLSMLRDVVVGSCTTE